MSEEVEAWVRGRIAAGDSRESIYTAMLAQGYHLQAIEYTYARAAYAKPATPETSRNHLLTFLFAFAGILMLASFITFIADRWRHMTDADRSLLLAIAGGVFIVVAYVVDQRSKFRAVATTFYFIGAFLIPVSFYASARFDEGPSALIGSLVGAVLFAGFALVVNRRWFWIVSAVLAFVASSSVELVEIRDDPGLGLALILIYGGLVALYCFGARGIRALAPAKEQV